MWKSGYASWINPFELIKFPIWMKINRKNILFRIRQLAFFLLHIPGYLALARDLGKPCYGGISDERVRIQYKYLGDYLVLGMSIKNKLNILIHNYNFLSKILPTSGAVLGNHGSFVLWSYQDKDSLFEIVLDVPDLNISFREGELVLLFSVDSRVVYTVTFVVVPAYCIDNNSDGSAILIGGIQGTAGCSDLVKHASKSVGEVFPSVLLLTALQALAISWGIDRIFAVTAAIQISPAVHKNPQRYQNIYDDFWFAQGGQQMGNFYLFSPLPAEKQVDELSTTHSSRSRRKRALKKQLLEEMSSNSARLFAR